LFCFAYSKLLNATEAGSEPMSDFIISTLIFLHQSSN
jgi:hypothetical protein